MANKVRLAAVAVLAVVLGVRVGGCDLPDILPIPSPIVVEGEVWVVVVHETESPLDGLANLKRSFDWMGGLSAREAKFRAYDDDQPEAKSYVDALGQGNSGILLITDSGKVVGQRLVESVSPALIDEMLAEVGR